MNYEKCCRGIAYAVYTYPLWVCGSRRVERLCQPICTIRVMEWRACFQATQWNGTTTNANAWTITTTMLSAHRPWSGSKRKGWTIDVRYQLNGLECELLHRYNEEALALHYGSKVTMISEQTKNPFNWIHRRSFASAHQQCPVRIALDLFDN